MALTAHSTTAFPTRLSGSLTYKADPMRPPPTIAAAAIVTAAVSLRNVREILQARRALGEIAVALFGGGGDRPENTLDVDPVPPG